MRRTIFAGLLAWVVWPAQGHAQADESAIIRELIAVEATRQGLLPRVALAFADEESGLRNLVGDMHRPELKRAYGPFQLQARFHLREGEGPLTLLHLPTNVERGVETIKRALRVAEGDVLKARFMYVCGRQFLRSCSSSKLLWIHSSWSRTWRRWRNWRHTVSTREALCYAPAHSKGDFTWPPKRKNPKTSSARWSLLARVTRRSNVASRTVSS